MLPHRCPVGSSTLPARPRRALGLLGVAVGALISAACWAPREASYTGSTPPQVLTTAESARVRDLRGVYRTALCRRLPAAGPPCDEVLLELAGETSAPPTGPRAGVSRRYRIALVPGFLAECFAGIVRPFSEPMEDLARAGFDVHYLAVAGRGSSEENSLQLAQQLSALAPDPRSFIVFAHSKGLPDVLELVVRHPEAAGAVAAIVSVAGAINGSPLADRLHPVFRAWLSSLPLPQCRQGDGEEILGLRREARLDWWRRHRGEMSKPVFSLVAAPRSDRISPALMVTYQELAKIEPRNDGMLIWHDQIVPAGGLLGYVNADHLAVAMSFSRALPGLAFLFRDDIPRTALVEAAIETVDAALPEPTAEER